MAGQGSKLVLVSPEQQKAGVKAAAFFVERKGVKVDSAAYRVHVATLQAFQRAGSNLPQFATLVGATSQNPRTGKIGAHGNLQRPWRFAEYTRKADDGGAAPDIQEKLSAGYGMTDGELSRMLSGVKPELVKAGILTDKGRKPQTDAARAAANAERTAKRIKADEIKGRKGTTGSISDIPAHNAWTLLQAAYKGITGEKLTALYKATGTAPAITGTDAPAPATRNMGGRRQGTAAEKLATQAG